MTSVDGKYKSSRVAEGYVDDCDAVTADQQTQDHDTPATIKKKMRTVAQTWANLIYGSRGKVLMEKSCWGLVWWIWKDSKARIATTDNITAEVKLTHSKEQNAMVLQHIKPTDAIRQLGIKNNMIGGHKVDFSNRYKSSIRMARWIKKNFISPKNALRIYQNIWLPAVQYPLACTTWSQKEYKKLTSLFLNAILPKLGLNKHFPWAVVHSSRNYREFQLAHLFIEQ
eukprot:3696571-Ditylum_brightwellii.AAC.1